MMVEAHDHPWTFVCSHGQIKGRSKTGMCVEGPFWEPIAIGKPMEKISLRKYYNFLRQFRFHYVFITLLLRYWYDYDTIRKTIESCYYAPLSMVIPYYDTTTTIISQPHSVHIKLEALKISLSLTYINAHIHRKTQLYYSYLLSLCRL